MEVHASAPGKAILCGEHAVVYGLPAIAIPLSGIRARAIGKASDDTLTVIAEDLGQTPLRIAGDDYDRANPLSLMAGLTATFVGAASIRGEIRIRSELPIASGLGSGAAVSAALGRAVAQLHGAEIPDEDLNRLVFDVEKLHHGTPSGIDNTVVVYEKPVYFRRDAAFEVISIRNGLGIVLADTGIASLTRDAVADVRALARKAPKWTGRVFDEIGAIVDEARDCIERGSLERLGALMTANHELLQALTVSSPELDALVDAAVNAGALGAKLSGGGRGGNIIVLCTGDSLCDVKESLLAAGSKRVLVNGAGQGSQDDDSD